MQKLTIELTRLDYHIWDATAEAYKTLNQKALMIKELNLHCGSEAGASVRHDKLVILIRQFCVTCSLMIILQY